MSKKCRAYSESRFGLEPSDNRKAFYAGWDAALREALAHAPEVREPPAQPQQEPVITKNEKGLTLHVGWDDLPAGTKLYTSPQPSKPLTFSKLCDIEYEITHRDGDFSILKFARAIEAAHGITGKTK